MIEPLKYNSSLNFTGNVQNVASSAIEKYQQAMMDGRTAHNRLLQRAAENIGSKTSKAIDKLEDGNVVLKPTFAPKVPLDEAQGKKLDIVHDYIRKSPIGEHFDRIG